MNFKIKLFLLFTLTLIFYSCINTNEKEKTISKTDYSFGLIEAKNIKGDLLNEEYTKVDASILNLSPDNLTHVIDYLALNSGEDQLKKWDLELKSSNSSLLVLGVFYAHKGWAIRGNSYATDVNETDVFSFIDYQNKALKILSKIQNNDLLIGEVYSRLIRIHMSLGDNEKAKIAFQKCIQIEPLKSWAYIHQLELIQPKWGGTLKETIYFKSTLPKSDLIRQLIDLKLIADSFTSGENLLANDTTSINDQALTLIKKVDTELSSNPQESILKFMIYNYIVGISQEIKNEELLNKYFQKMENHYTLYPFGIME